MQYEPRVLNFPKYYEDIIIHTDVPTISIVTSTLNQGRFLEATIDSITNQEYPKLSYFVQDAGSTDGSLDILRSYGDRIEWASEPDSGQSNGLNKGFTRISGEIMAYLNGDDVLTPGSLAYVASVFAANPDVDVVYGHRINIDQNGLEIGRWVLPPHDPKAIKWADYIPQETMFWRRRVWESVGPFDENMRFALDWDFILKAVRAGFSFKRLPRFLGCFRIHSQQKTMKDAEIGAAESKSLREIHLGFDPSQSEITKALRPYIRRHILFHKLYKFPLVRY